MTWLMRLLTALHGGLSLVQRGLTRLLLGVAPDYFAPVIDWPKPEGPHQVGTREMEIPGSARNGARRLMARLWYPAASVEGHERRAYFGDAAELRAMALGLDGLLSAALVRRLGLVRTWSHEEAEIIRGTKLPVIIFSHGFTGYVGQNTHLCEHLASHGYLVASLAHPGGASIVRYPDGSLIRQTRAMLRGLVTPQFLLDMWSLFKVMTPQDRLDLLQRITLAPMAGEDQRWAENISDAIGGLSSPQSEAETGGIMAQADWSRVGLVGMSLGGSASASAAQADPRVHVVVNLDGMQQGSRLLNTSIRVPLLVMHGPRALAIDGTACTRHHYQTPDTGDVGFMLQRWLVRGAHHLDFTDLTAFGRGPVRSMLHLGGIDGTLMLQASASLVRHFLDVHLRGAEPMADELTVAQHPCLTPIHGKTHEVKG